IAIANHNVPLCAMSVTRDGDLGPLASYVVPESLGGPCACYFEAKANGTTACQACPGGTDAEGTGGAKCRPNYCAAYLHAPHFNRDSLRTLFRFRGGRLRRFESDHGIRRRFGTTTARWRCRLRNGFGHGFGHGGRRHRRGTELHQRRRLLLVQAHERPDDAVP